MYALFVMTQVRITANILVASKLIIGFARRAPVPALLRFAIRPRCRRRGEMLYRSSDGVTQVRTVLYRSGEDVMKVQ
jgi:hypothetical protein